MLDKLAEVDGSLVFLGMGSAAGGKEFARKLRLDLELFPLVVDAPPGLELYQALGLRNEQNALPGL